MEYIPMIDNLDAPYNQDEIEETTYKASAWEENVMTKLYEIECPEGYTPEEWLAKENYNLSHILKEVKTFLEKQKQTPEITRLINLVSGWECLEVNYK